MANTPICSVDAAGIHRPTLADCLAYVTTAYKNIYGQDVYLEPDAQDYQLLALFASAIDDANAMSVAVYNAFSPSTAQGVGLSRVVKINGIARKIPTYSTVAVNVVGTVGTIITGGVVRSVDQGTLWDLPATVTIPQSGEISVTATSKEPGAIRADAGEIIEIQSNVAGWDSVINIGAASPGAPVELDGELRQRQAVSAALPSVSSFAGLVSGIGTIQSVSRYRIYENADPGVDILGIPGHSVAVVIDGGDFDEVTSMIELKKGEGVSTFGMTTRLAAPDVFGIRRQVSFTVPEDIPITYILQVRTKPGFTTDVITQIQQALSDWTNSLGIGNDVPIIDAYIAARLNGDVASTTYMIVPDSLRMSRDGLVPITSDIAMGFAEAPFCTPGYVTIQLLS